MKIKLEKLEDYNRFVEINSSDVYSFGVIAYMQKWAEMMEHEMAAGKTVSDAATETEHKADTEGITGFMYGCAVNALSQFWEHGEELRQWHNKDCGYIGEGTVNPAILTIG